MAEMLTTGWGWLGLGAAALIGLWALWFLARWGYWWIVRKY